MLTCDNNQISSTIFAMLNAGAFGKTSKPFYRQKCLDAWSRAISKLQASRAKN